MTAVDRVGVKPRRIARRSRRVMLMGCGVCFRQLRTYRRGRQINYVPCADVLEPTSSITGSGSHEPSGMNLCGYLVVFRVIYFPTSCSANTVLRISFTDILAVSVAAAS
jgi:hypothetical protein